MKDWFRILVHNSPARLLQYLRWRFRLFAIRRFPFLYPGGSMESTPHTEWSESLAHPDCYAEGTFTMLNLSKKLNGNILWDYSGFGKLWNYQLQGFEFLLQPGMTKEEGTALMRDFSIYYQAHPSLFSPYTATLRIIHWVKFLSLHPSVDRVIRSVLAADAARLSRTIEYHLQNNHVLENGFALLFAGSYFNSENLFSQGRTLIEKELSLQLLADGGHFERSPMYHQIVLSRILDTVRWLRMNRTGSDVLQQTLVDAASRMVAWMNAMQFSNGEMPQLNDSAPGMAPAPESLRSYAQALNIPETKIQLKESGYRKFATRSYECLVDAGALEPAANAGHAHADALHFILYVNSHSFIIDTGTSTYESGDRRLFERSTSAHNTVTKGKLNQSELWGAFRVGKRAVLLGVQSGPDYLEAAVRFARSGMIHKRRFDFGANSLTITDLVSGGSSALPTAFFYVDKKSELAHAKSKVNSNIASIDFEGDSKISIDEAYRALGFNRCDACKCVAIQFKERLITTFTFHQL